MATKEEVLQSIRELSAKGSIKKDDILAAFEAGLPEDIRTTKKIGIAEILYYIGGAIVFFGIAIFITQNWRSLSSASRIISTLGSGVAAYFSALFFSLKKKTENISLAFFLISALVMPIGLFVVFYEAGYKMSTHGMQSIISFILFTVFLSSLTLFRKSIFIVFSVIFGSWMFFAITNFLIGGAPGLGQDFFYYRILAVGLSYILLGYYFSKNKREAMSGSLYGFGVFGFLGAALMLGGWKPEQKMFWELVFPGLIFAVLFLSVYLKSRSFLTFGTLYLMVYIIKITTEYFSGSLGWPLSLVIIGFLLIASGYLFVYIKNNFIRGVSVKSID